MIVTGGIEVDLKQCAAAFGSTGIPVYVKNMIFTGTEACATKSQ